MAPVLEVSHLTKRFDRFTAVDDLSFSIEEGEIVGLLGPNGAGKTTTIQMLLGLISPTSGAISYFGKNFFKQREASLSAINFASAYAQMQGRITVRQNLRIYAGLYNVPNREKKISDLIELFEITQVADTLFWHLSAGQKTRAVLAKSLLNDPKLILMDEPTASLDPDIALKVMELIERLQKNHKTAILYTSHNMEEIERLADRVMFLSHGKVLAEDTPLGLTKKVGDSTLRLTYEGKKSVLEKYLKQQSLSYTYPREHVVEIQVADTQIPTVLFALSREGIWITEIDIEKPDLEDVFLSIAKGEYEVA